MAIVNDARDESKSTSKASTNAPADSTDGSPAPETAEKGLSTGVQRVHPKRIKCSFCPKDKNSTMNRIY